MDVEKFVQNVKTYCALKGTTPTVACRESGAGKSMISNLQNHDIIPSIERVQMLAAHLDCTVSDLLGEGNGETATQTGSGLEGEFVKLFGGLTPENKTTIIAEMLKRQREQE